MQRTQTKRAARSSRRRAAPNWPLSLVGAGFLVSLMGFTQPWVQASTTELSTEADPFGLGIAVPETVTQPMSGLELLKPSPLLWLALGAILISGGMAARTVMRREMDADSSVWQVILAVVAAAAIAVAHFIMHFGLEEGTTYFQYGYIITAVGLAALIVGGVAGFRAAGGQLGEE